MNPLRTKFRLVIVGAIVFAVAAELAPQTLPDDYSTDSGLTGKMQAINSGDSESKRNETSGPPTPRLVKANGVPTIRLNRARQKHGGIICRVLTPVTYRNEVSTYGKIVDIQPLLDLRRRINKIRAEQSVTGAELSEAKLEVQRVRRLYAENAVPLRKFIRAKTALVSAKARADMRAQQLRHLRDEARMTWGAKIASWMFVERASEYYKLASNQSVLVLVSVKAGESMESLVDTVFINRRGNRENAQEASFVAVAPATSLETQYEAYFFSTDAANLRTNMRVNVWIPKGEQAATGYLLPIEAIVWYAGQPWIYLKIDSDLFMRRRLADYREDGEFLFTSQSFAENQEIVVTGSQMLLSEEFRQQIPDDD